MHFRLMADLSEITELTERLNAKLQDRIKEVPSKSNNHKLKIGLQIKLSSQKLQEERAEFLAEKAVMQCLTANDSDIIKLNVRGKLLETRRSTLCQVNYHI